MLIKIYKAADGTGEPITIRSDTSQEDIEEIMSHPKADEDLLNAARLILIVNRKMMELTAARDARSSGRETH